MSMVIVRTEQQIITKQHPKWLFINEMCGHTKDLYNYANYLIRQEFTQNRQYIKYREINFNLKSHELYKSCMSQPANCVLRRLDKNWKSFFKAIKDWKEHIAKRAENYENQIKQLRAENKELRRTITEKDEEVFLFTEKDLQARIKKERETAVFNFINRVRFDLGQTYGIDRQLNELTLEDIMENIKSIYKEVYKK